MCSCHGDGNALLSASLAAGSDVLSVSIPFSASDGVEEEDWSVVDGSDC